jgi:CRP-like cAMP-binding protein
MSTSSFSSYFGELNEAELKVLLTHFKAEKLAKNDFFTEAGRQCERLSLVQTGILRVFALDEDGREITQWLSTPDSFITEIASFFFNQNNRWSIQALTEVELLSLHKSDYLRLCETFPKWNNIEKKFIALYGLRGKAVDSADPLRPQLVRGFLYLQ